MGNIDEMGLVKLDLFEVNKIMSCSYLKNVYEGFRFNGSIRENYIDKKDIVSKSKSNIEVMRRYGRDIIRSLDVQKDNLKSIRNYAKRDRLTNKRKSVINGY